MSGKFIFILCSLALTCVPSEPDPVEIVRRSLDRDTMNFRRGREYTYQREEVTRHLDGRGSVKKTESSTFDVVTLHGELYSRLVAKDGAPLTGKQSREAERDWNEALRKREGETPEERSKRLERRRREEEEGRRFLGEIPEAFQFRLLGEETVDGHAAWVISAEPRPDYRPKVKRADLLRKFKGRLWIDKAEYQWVRVEAETVDTVSFGLVLARLGKGARVTFEQRRVNSEVWLPSRATMRLDAKLALMKSLRLDNEVKWSGYRKFQTDSRIVSVEELNPPGRE
jgi:hypothetical protein